MTRRLIGSVALLVLAWAPARGADPTVTRLEIHWDIKHVDFQGPAVPAPVLRECCARLSGKLVEQWEPNLPFRKFAAPVPSPGAPPVPRLVIEVFTPIDHRNAPVGVKLVARDVPGLDPIHELFAGTLYRTGEYAQWMDQMSGAELEQRLSLFLYQLNEVLQAAPGAVRRPPGVALSSLFRFVPVADGVSVQQVAGGPVWTLPLAPHPSYPNPQFRLVCRKEPAGKWFDLYTRAARADGPPANIVCLERVAGFDPGLKVQAVFLDDLLPVRPGLDIAH